MPSSAAEDAPFAASVAAKEFAFVSWVGSNGRRACPLATFGSRAPQQLQNARLACAEPPRADQPELTNAAELCGAIALVVRGGCTFAHKARLLQRAGAVAMLLANNTREEPFAAFTMGESAEELAHNAATGAEELTLPCVMMCLRDVRGLFQKFPPSVKNGALTFEILPSAQAAAVAAECLQLQKQQQAAADGGRGWKAIKRTTSSIIKLLDPQTALPASSIASIASSSSVEGEGEKTSEPVQTPTLPSPLFAFVQWATSASTYAISFAPLAEFAVVRAGASYSGKLVVCDPLLADQEPLRNPKQLLGAVVLVRRGSCSFPEKLERLQRAGAVAAIVGNDDEKDPDAAFVMSVDHIDAANATLPAVMVSHNAFQRLMSDPNVGTARVLCLSGEAAEGLLAESGGSVSFAEMPMPFTKSSQNEEHDGGNDDEELQDPLLSLHVACRDGDHGACQRVLAQIEGDAAKRELVRSSCSDHGLTALHHACAAGNDNVVELLLRLGAAPDALDLAMQTPLHIACEHRHLECARLLMRAEAAVTKTLPPVLLGEGGEGNTFSTRRHIGGGTALHAAAQAGSAECVELLLTANAWVDNTVEEGSQGGKYRFLGVNLKDVEGQTPLHLACARAHDECALYLVAANADVNAEDSSGRSPLLLACEAANDPEKEARAVRIIEKLITVDARMEDSQGEEGVATADRGDRLLLDRVESQVLRREIEILYVRHEARRARRSNERLKQDNCAMSRRLEALENDICALKQQEIEREGHGQQLQQLRLQMQSILQFLSTQQIPWQTSSVATGAIVPSQLLATAASNPQQQQNDAEGQSEEELALDAALARDLGKKCFRQKQWALAETYFQRSLSLLPLPGVRRLLTKARTLRTESIQVPEHIEKPLSSALNPNGGDLRDSRTKHAVIQRFRGLLQTAQAAPQLQTALDREIIKLEALEEGTSDFASTCRWIEWLVALPWGDPESGLQNEDLYHSKRDVFQQLELLEREGREAHRHQAARRIQRAFREHFAVHLLTRSAAAARIQAVARGRSVRMNAQTLREQLLEARTQVNGGFVSNGRAGDNVSLPSEVDYTTSVDATMHRKLQHDRSHVKLVVGEVLRKLQQSQKPGSSSGFVANEFRVVQLVECAPTQRGVWPSSGGLEPLAAFHQTPSRLLFYVWTRWGQQMNERCECVLSGPYDDRQDAQRRFERIIRDDRSRGLIAASFDDECSPANGKALAGPSQWPQPAALAPRLASNSSATTVASA
ncbi:hypothetical protein BBJ28_00010179 [Nothophytophthora sp. Chile5]|nr:hypothetical protein BBJ28_00010179 [Nothophytophthora sp. Chile5]